MTATGTNTSDAVQASDITSHADAAQSTSGANPSTTTPAISSAVDINPMADAAVEDRLANNTSDVLDDFMEYIHAFDSAATTLY